MSATLENTAAPLVGAEQIELLERLSNAVAVSGDEGAVRRIVLEAVRPLADEVVVDAMGSVLATFRASRPNAPRVMLAAHMDEVGFMIVKDDGDGLYQFETVGGLDPAQLPGKPVLVGKDNLPGVIGATAIHLTTREEREQKIPVRQLRIDLGPEGAGKVKPGDRAGFATRFKVAGPSLVGKALDDRLGVATLIELAKNPPRNVELQLAFTVQEEVGLRGARAAAYRLQPDLALAIDSTPAFDLPTWDDEENTQYNTRLGEGPAIYLADRGTLSDPRLTAHLAAAARRNNIPFQYRQPGGGGTDAAAIHRTRAGVPSASISVPGRYAHSAVMVARLDDWSNTLALVRAALEELPDDLLGSER